MSQKLKELRDRLASLQGQGRAKAKEADTLGAKATRTADEDARIQTLASECDTLVADIETVGEEIKAEEARVETARRRASAFGSTASVGQAGDDRGQAPAFGAARTVGELDPSRTYGFKSTTEFARAVIDQTTGANFDERLAGPSTFNRGSGSAGEGFVVPPAFRDQLFELAFDTSGLLGMVDYEETGGSSVEIGADESTPWGATGVQAYWRGEAQAMTGSKADTDNRVVKVHELYAFVTATSELLADGPRLRDRLTRKSGQAIRWKAEDSVINANGTGKPLGFLNAPAKLTIAKDAGQATKTITVSNIANMFAAMLVSGDMSSMAWIANTEILPQLIGLTIGNVPVFTPPNAGMKDAPGGYILGRPVIWTESAKTLGTEGDLSFVNLKGYYSPRRGGSADNVEFAESIHLYFDQALTAFRWTFRMGGQPHLSKPVTTPTGGKKSHFITLANRP